MCVVFFFFKQKTAYEMRISDWSSDVCSSDLALSNIFLDSLSMDVERMQRINDLLAQLPINALKSQSLRPVSTFVVTPSQSLDEMALAHLEKMPRAARRSEERRGGKECVRTCRSRWSAYH